MEIEPLRVICDPPATGTWNMAADEYLLASARAAGQVTLRFYQWSEPTLSLGYFQSLDDRAQHVASRNCPLVRRSSGGGAIVHDRELTYSLALPLSDRWSATATKLYGVMHGAIILALREYGIEAHLCSGRAIGGENVTDRNDEPFLCFQRRAAGDVLIGEFKIAGSAQRRRYGALLQHGSVLLAQSGCAPELPGIAEIGRRDIAAVDFAQDFQKFIHGNKDFFTILNGYQWTSDDLKQIAFVENQQFLSTNWTSRR